MELLLIEHLVVGIWIGLVLVLVFLILGGAATTQDRLEQLQPEERLDAVVHLMIARRLHGAAPATLELIPEGFIDHHLPPVLMKQRVAAEPAAVEDGREERVGAAVAVDLRVPAGLLLLGDGDGHHHEDHHQHRQRAHRDERHRRPAAHSEDDVERELERALVDPATRHFVPPLLRVRAVRSGRVGDRRAQQLHRLRGEVLRHRFAQHHVRGPADGDFRIPILG
mmetsp:Transcript_35303/g.87844  ORF Transcript_35303/g.87844 Transcript_35303/m.87844 type:complete len:224 (-) Transcript_35303:465-1136(-)